MDYQAVIKMFMELNKLMKTPIIKEILKSLS